MTRSVDVAILGAGTAGLQAVAEVRRVTDSYVLINAGPEGTLCARAGCMPSKALIQVARDYHRRRCLHRWGLTGADALRAPLPEVLRHVRDLRDTFVGNVVDGVVAHIPAANRLSGHARLLAPTELDVDGTRITARAVVIATGSRPVVPEPWRAFGDRVLTTDDLYDRIALPRRLGVIGLGPLGLETGQALSRLGIAVTGVESGGSIGGITDPHVNDAAVALMSQEFPLWLGGHAMVETVEAADPSGPLRLRCGGREGEVDGILAAVGRAPAIDGLGLECLGVPLDDTGLPPFDPTTCQVGDLPVFMAGDCRGGPAILHEARDEGRIAGHNAVRLPAEPQAFRRRCPLQVVYTEPQIVRIGAAWPEVEDLDVVTAEAGFAHTGRARIMGEARGTLRLYADRQDGRLLGAALCAPEGEHLAHSLALAVDQGMTVHDLAHMTTYHPTLEEALKDALREASEKAGGDALPSVGLRPMA